MIFSGTGEIGDTIGGITSPVIGLFNAFLLYLTIKEQYVFNKEQHIFNEKQKKDSFDAQFKNTFFELLRNQLNMLENMKGNFYFITPTGPYSKYIESNEFFSYAIFQLKIIYNALEYKNYIGVYDKDYDVSEYYSEISEPIANIPEEAAYIDNKYRVRYTNSIYSIIENNYKKYNEMNIYDKVGIIYIHFYNRYDVVGVYFRHLYNT